MSYGYLGDTSTSIKQQVKNAGVLSVSDVLDLENKGQLGGSLELIEEQTVSGVSAVDFLTIQENKFDVHLLTVDNAHITVDSRRYTIQFYESGVLETASVYQYAHQAGNSNGGFAERKSTSSNHIRGSSTFGNATGESSQGYIYFYNLGNSSKYSFVTSQTVQMDTSPDFTFEFGGGVMTQASVVDGIRISVTDGFDEATFKLYGVKQI